MEGRREGGKEVGQRQGGRKRNERKVSRREERTEGRKGFSAPSDRKPPSTKLKGFLILTSKIPPFYGQHLDFSCLTKRPKPTVNVSTNK